MPLYVVHQCPTVDGMEDDTGTQLVLQPKKMLQLPLFPLALFSLMGPLLPTFVGH